MVYKIIVNYYTGNSFYSEDCSTTIDYNWQNLDVVKENVYRIKQHYEMYEKLNDYRTPKTEILPQYTEKPWFVNSQKYGWDVYEYSVNLLLDDRSSFVYSTQWCGYFEGLYDISIEADINADSTVYDY